MYVLDNARIPKLPVTVETLALPVAAPVILKLFACTVPLPPVVDILPAVTISPVTFAIPKMLAPVAVADIAAFALPATYIETVVLAPIVTLLLPFCIIGMLALVVNIP